MRQASPHRPGPLYGGRADGPDTGDGGKAKTVWTQTGDSDMANVTSIHSTKIVKDAGGEWRVKAFDENGKYIPGADYFTPDRADAEKTAAVMPHGVKPTGRGVRARDGAGESILAELLKWGWSGADAVTMNNLRRDIVWGSAGCWSNWLGTSHCGQNIVNLWVSLQGFIRLADPVVRGEAVAAFAAAADVVAYG